MDTHLIPFSHDHGFSTTVTSTAVSLLAGFNIAGILLSGIVADRWSSRKILCFLYAVRALSIVILIYSHELLAFSLCDSVWISGLCNGSTDSNTRHPVLSKLLDRPHDWLAVTRPSDRIGTRCVCARRHLHGNG